MHPDDWHVTHDLDDFLARTEGFLRSRPGPHTLQLTVTETLRTRGMNAFGDGTPVFGWLERAGEVVASFFRTPPRHLSVTRLSSGDADALAARLSALGHPLPGVNADHATATAFAEAWQRHTGAAPNLGERHRLYRLDTLTPPTPVPEGRARVAGERDRAQLIAWHDEFALATHTIPSGAAGWADERIAGERVTFWETPDGAPVSMAGLSPVVAGQARLAPVYTPAHLRGRGYGGAATVAASRAALARGATDLVLFADLANPTSNGLYRRIGYRPVTDFFLYHFSPVGPPTT
ncbi:GNAT family N-acetyltransferase [Streptomyces sp. CT1-17]|uniref:GNAT family N-acetyltransferase n=1 Tax=unclassified Streptomyces TaxID=2593676 RepID=UPI001413D91C|nr:MULTISPECIES: GNAT family N-acetyltransferase [unclassified Streptomyces]MCC2269719.1 GNAT family N-acetyltransferase [Streptomyces sp. CT1-17]QIP68699.1 GNAT family N-acetyltransferase [Streptomyces sp. VN1]